MLNVTLAAGGDGELCPIRNVLSKVTGKWSTLVLLSLGDGPLRFSQIKRALGDITQRVLTENLRTLERDGYVSRSVSSGSPVRVTYRLTPLGVECVGVLRPLVHWAESRFDEVIANRETFDGGQGSP